VTLCSSFCCCHLGYISWKKIGKRQRW